MQFKIRLLVIAFYTLSIALLWFVKLQDCRSYCYTWYGMLPAQVGCCTTALASPILMFSWTHPAQGLQVQFQYRKSCRVVRM